MATFLRSWRTLPGRHSPSSLSSRPAHDRCSLFDNEGFAVRFDDDPDGDRCWAPIYALEDRRVKSDVSCVRCSEPVIGRV